MLKDINLSVREKERSQEMSKELIRFSIDK